MKIKLFLSLVTIVCLVLLSACVKVEEKAITGDVKDDGNGIHELDGGRENAPETETEEEIVAPADEYTAEDAAGEIGAVILSDKGGFYDDALSFIYALGDKDYAVVTSYTGGKSQAYSFLESTSFGDFEVFHIEFTDEKLKALEDGGFYPAFDEGYLARIDVRETGSDRFVQGEEYYFLGFSESTPMGYNLTAFVPARICMKYAFTDTKNDGMRDFAREFISLYGDNLSEGRNYPDSFDFSSSSHLITHLMAENGFGVPPYSLESINSFIEKAFDSAPPLSYGDVNNEYWLYPVYSDIESEGDKLYGCSYAHGGYTVEHTVTSYEKDGEDVTLELEVFADYSRFALSSRVRMSFVCREGEVPMLMMASVSKISDAGPAVVSL